MRKLHVTYQCDGRDEPFNFSNIDAVVLQNGCIKICKDGNEDILISETDALSSMMIVPE